MYHALRVTWPVQLRFRNRFAGAKLQAGGMAEISFRAFSSLGIDNSHHSVLSGSFACGATRKLISANQPACNFAPAKRLESEVEQAKLPAVRGTPPDGIKKK